MNDDRRVFGTLMDELRLVAFNEALPIMTRLDAAVARLRAATQMMEQPGCLKRAEDQRRE